MRNFKINKKTFFFFLIVLVVAFSVSGVALAEDPIDPKAITSPLKGEVGTSIIQFINFILENIVLPIGAVAAVLFLIYAGFLFVTAQGNEEKLSAAKKTFLWTVIGVLILLGAVAISNGIKNTICQITNVPGLNCP